MSIKGDEDNMTIDELGNILGLPSGVMEQLHDCQERRKKMPGDIKEKLFCRSTWENGIAELKDFLGEDPYSMGILLEQMDLVCEYTYEEYVKRGISKEIFVETFGFITRFVSPTKDSNGKYRYDWAWWLQRQITLQEFRIGSLEYEFVEEENNRRIEIHIPSDANMKLEVLCQSVRDFLEFENKYFPEWVEVDLTTETWMIMPELDKFLTNESKILQFKRLFNIVSVDYSQTWYMGWIFPGYSEINDDLPENTTLHRKLKQYLLEGNKFGIAKGNLILERVYKILETL